MGQENKAAIIFNATFVRPTAFYLNGFSNIPNTKYFYIFLCFIYIMTVVGNGLLISVIYLVKTLHTPKYMIVFSLALTDLCGSTALIPKVLDTFLFDRRYIVYEACLSYMFFVWFFAFVQSWTLVTMAYDRFIAICFPLRYHSIVTKQAVGAMLFFAWGFLLSIIACMAGLIDRLSFCGSLVIESFFCDHGPVYHLACNDTTLNYIIAKVAITLIIFIPLVLITLTYVCIAIALSRIASGVERLKALKTCTSHLILVAIFFLPLMGTNLAAMTSYIHPNARIFNSTLTHTVVAVVKPLVKKCTPDSGVYRPKSNLPFIIKILKKLLKSNYNHLCRHNRYEDFQSGFIVYNSTETAPFEVTNDLLLTSENGLLFILVLLELSAALDTIEYNILLHRLEHVIRIKRTALGGFKSYLSDSC